MTDLDLQFFFLPTANQANVDLLIDSALMQDILQIVQIVGRMPLQVSENVSDDYTARICRPARLDVHHEQTAGSADPGLFLQRLRNRYGLHDHAYIRSRDMSSSQEFFACTNQRR